jgi:uncharacterized HAD superfamily protein/hypoxanthine phosphoribosyltransferase
MIKNNTTVWRPNRESINTRTVRELDKSIRANLHRLPDDIGLVVGVPRSGMIPAGLIATYLNVPLADINGLLDGSLGYSGFRNNSIEIQKRKKILIVDDSISTGKEMRRVRSLIKDKNINEDNIRYLAIFGASLTHELCDYVFESVPFPRIFSWNAVNSWIVATSCVDIDGLLCPDPTQQENDDGKNYINFLKNAPLLYSCRFKIKHLVTARLEKYRSITEEWLQSKGIQYDNLHMANLDSAKIRSKKGGEFHVKHKAYYYSKLDDTILFLESAKWQAQLIAEKAAKPVFCIEDGMFYHPTLVSLRKAQLNYYLKYPRAFFGLAKNKILNS